MSNLTCPKCGGSDYFLSKRNIVKGMGWAQRGSLKSVPVCRVCDEIMDGAQVGMSSWEDLGRKSKFSAYNSYKFNKIDWILFSNFVLWFVISIATPYESSFYNPVNIVSTLSLWILIFRVGQVFLIIRKRQK